MSASISQFDLRWSKSEKDWFKGTTGCYAHKCDDDTTGIVPRYVTGHEIRCPNSACEAVMSSATKLHLMSKKISH